MEKNSTGTYSVKLSKIIEYFHLKNLTPDVNIDKIRIYQADINRPALQFAGFFDHFDNQRIQLIGKVECKYLQTHPEKYVNEVIRKICQFGVPCLVFCRGINPSGQFIDMGNEYGVPILQTDVTTSNLLSEMNRYLKIELAPRITIHGVLINVFGEGLLIVGESGAGKSETALELVKRGHRLVADDAVLIKKINDADLIGEAPAVTKYFIELRGIGVIDVKALYGVQSVEDKMRIDLVIKLDEWNKSNEYDRLGMTDDYEDILGISLVRHKIPVSPGRNLAIIIETAAINHRQKRMGYNAAQELYKRVTDKMKEDYEKEKENQ